jgi:nicotinamidase-related amidase
VPPGREPLGGSMASTISSLVEAVRICGGMVVHAWTRPPQRLAGKWRDVSARPMVDSYHAQVTVRSGGVDAFFASDLELVLRTRGIERIILCGSGLETSVHSTMRSANDRGFECLLVADACVADDQDLAAASVSMIEMSGGIFGAVGMSSPAIRAIFAATSGSIASQGVPA